MSGLILDPGGGAVGGGPEAPPLHGGLDLRDQLMFEWTAAVHQEKCESHQKHAASFDVVLLETLMFNDAGLQDGELL